MGRGRQRRHEKITPGERPAPGGEAERCLRSAKSWRDLGGGELGGVARSQIGRGGGHHEARIEEREKSLEPDLTVLARRDQLISHEYLTLLDAPNLVGGGFKVLDAVLSAGRAGHRARDNTLGDGAQHRRELAVGWLGFVG